MDSSHNPHLKDGDYDYGEPHDVIGIHAQAVASDKPRDGISIWFVGFVGVICLIAGVYLALFSGGFKGDAYSIYDGGLSRPGGAGGADAPPPLTLAQIGEGVFKKNCTACHMANGQGLAGVYPPLVASDWVTGNDERLAAILLHGIQGPLKVNGAVYNGAMPPWKSLKDEQIAAVITYIRSSWGNAASEVQPDQVAVAREKFKAQSQPWTEAELLQITGTLPPSTVAPK